MTKDEIRNMPAGREMDELIAHKIMGYIDGKKTHQTAKGYWWSTTHIPNYSSGISSSWEVVDEFYSMTLDKYSNGAEWICYIVGERDGKNTDGNSTADTAPLAICRAALLTTLELK